MVKGLWQILFISKMNSLLTFLEKIILKLSRSGAGLWILGKVSYSSRPLMTCLNNFDNISDPSVCSFIFLICSLRRPWTHEDEQIKIKKAG